MGTVKYSGPVASFHCPTNAKIRSLKVHFSPKQLGEGDPSPENVREIVGWDGVEVNQDGENLFPAAFYTRTANGITFTYYPNGDIHVEGTATATTWLNVPTSMYFIITPGTYTISGNKSDSQVKVYLVVSRDNGGDIKFYTNNGVPTTKMIDFTDSEARVQITVSSGKTVNVMVHPKLERGSYTTTVTTDYEFGVLGKNKLDIPDTSFTRYKKYTLSTPLKPAVYTISALVTSTDTDQTISSIMFKGGQLNGNNLYVRLDRDSRSAKTFTLEKECSQVYLYASREYDTSANDTATWTDIQLELGSTATTYEPYNPNHTVYGGWVDLITGEVASMYIHCKIKDLPGEWNYHSNNVRFQITLTDDYANAASSGGIWTHFATSEVYKTSTSNGYGNKQIATYINKHIYIRDDDFEGDVEAFLNGVGDTYITYELAEPTTYFLSPTSMQTFLGQNNVWSNADYVEVEYDLHETQDILARKQFIMANQPHIVKPAAAPLQNFVTDMAAPLKECKVHFEPAQDLHGYSKPWIGGSGKNLFNNQYPDIDTSLHYISIYVGDSTVTVSTTCPWGYNGEAACLFALAGDVQSGASSDINGLSPTVFRTITPIDGYITIAYRIIEDVDPRNYNTQIELGSTATAYEPYENICPISGWTGLSAYVSPTFNAQDGTTYLVDWTDEAGTVYGGYVDLVTGEVWQTWDYVALDTLKWERFGGNGVFYNSSIRRKAGNPIYSNILTPTLTADSGYTAVEPTQIFYYKTNTTYKNYLMTHNSDFVGNLSGYRQWMKDTYPGAIAVYELETPILLTTLTQTQLKTLHGTNNIWSNANGNVEVQYWTH